MVVKFKIDYYKYFVSNYVIKKIKISIKKSNLKVIWEIFETNN
jgi:hypothetical protein